MLTHHNTTSYLNTIHIENKTNNIETLNQIENQVINLSSLQNQIEFDKSANSEKRYPLFTLDLLYGWPIDPRNCESSITEEIILNRNWTQEKIPFFWHFLCLFMWCGSTSVKKGTRLWPLFLFFILSEIPWVFGKT